MTVRLESDYELVCEGDLTGQTFTGRVRVREKLSSSL